jgi:hypothetical protein
VARNYDDDRERLSEIGLSFYALRKDGKYAGASLWDREGNSDRRRSAFTVNDGGKSRAEDGAYLFER